MFEKVTRKKAKLRMALTGVSGAGKTLSALYIAYGITNDWGRIALMTRLCLSIKNISTAPDRCRSGRAKHRQKF